MKSIHTWRQRKSEVRADVWPGSVLDPPLGRRVWHWLQRTFRRIPDPVTESLVDDMARRGPPGRTVRRLTHYLTTELNRGVYNGNIKEWAKEAQEKDRHG